MLSDDTSQHHAYEAPSSARKPVASERNPTVQLMDSEEAAALMKVHPKTLQKLARRGELKGIHVGKLWRFREVDIADWIQRQVAS